MILPVALFVGAVLAGLHGAERPFTKVERIRLATWILTAAGMMAGLGFCA